jgi:hypothetical protein
MAFAINTNLIAKDETIDRLIEKSKNIKSFSVYTSCESSAKHAEYIRDGFDYEVWRKNLIRLLTEGNIKGLNVMMTINSLCLFDITEFLDDIYSIKQMTNSKTPTVSLNLLRFPSFQSPLALPDHIKNYCREKLSAWYENVKDRPLWHDFEKASIERLIDYLDIVEAPHRRTSNKITLWRDFKTFYSQYDQRRNKNLVETFPEILKDWYETIPSTTLKEKTSLISGDSTRQYINDEDLMRIAQEEGWILTPDSSNIGEPLGKYD